MFAVNGDGEKVSEALTLFVPTNEQVTAATFELVTQEGLEGRVTSGGNVNSTVSPLFMSMFGVTVILY